MHLSKSIFTILILVLLSGCGAPKILNVSEPLKFSQLSMSQMESAIVAAAKKTGWKLTKDKNGHFSALLRKNDYVAKVSISFSPNLYSIDYVDSQNLEHEGDTIHKAYNGWVNNLSRHIKSNIRKIENGTFQKKETSSISKLYGSIVTALATDNDSSADSSSKKENSKKLTTEEATSMFTFRESNQIKQNDFALVIGVSKYRSSPGVEFADNSALAFSELAQKTFGIPKENVMLLIDDEASSGSIKSSLHLLKELADTDSTIYFYYAGHGLPSRSGETYILPYDMSAAAVEVETQLQIDNIYKVLGESKAKKIFVVLDSCFSGKDTKGELLYEGVAPIFKVKKVEPKKRMTVFSAGGPEEFANDFKEQKHRMFTYFLIDAINSGSTVSEEIYNNTKTNVKRASLQKGLVYKQVPRISGEKKNNLY